MLFASTTNKVEDDGFGGAAVSGATVIDVREEMNGKLFFVDDPAEEVLISKKKMVVCKGAFGPFWD